MIVKCAWCGKIMGRKSDDHELAKALEIAEDGEFTELAIEEGKRYLERVTHSICDDCAKKVMADMGPRP